MNLRTQLRQLQKDARNIPPPDEITMICAVPTGEGLAETQPPGVYFNVDGTVATVVFEGSEPDAEVIARLQARMPKWGMTIVCNPDTILPPLDDPAAERSEGEP